ncbi:hypothetical protein I79_009823 [Cricetulus griseus]|uniref:Secreted protein n=1 Tax=Cricetulus griseus TaxID=10029 RepID=G3HGT2_CRIGR|nr:hypothetical protein I79_009823 [Cricetulus griseus]
MFWGCCPRGYDQHRTKNGGRNKARTTLLLLFLGSGGLEGIEGRIGQDCTSRSGDGDALPLVLGCSREGKAPAGKGNVGFPPTPRGAALDPESPHTRALWHPSS